MAMILKTPGDKDQLVKVEKFCTLHEPYKQRVDSDEMFMEAMREILKWHEDHCEYYKRLCIDRKFSVDKLDSMESLDRIPLILANFFKYHEVLSIKREDVALHLTSSGTTGQKSQIFFDSWSIGIAQRMVDLIWQYYGWDDQRSKVNYLLYTYEPEEGSNLGTAYTDNFLCKYAPINFVKYALRFVGNGEHRFDFFGCVEALRKFEEERLPVRIFGFPAFLFFTLKKMRELKMPPLTLNPNSLVFLGGGWKGYQDQAISKSELYSLAHDMLGIPDSRLRDGFGSVEHCIPYIECSHHNFHQPVWSRVFIRHVRTLKKCDYGEIGYLNFISPYITSVPANNVLMGDLAVLHEGKECGCEIETPWFEIVGRAGLAKNKSCAVSASEILGKF